MANDYKTPGVYVVEKSIFPPSVAQVETAIPAFIGYTQTAMYKKADDLLLKPKRISSLLEYKSFFGGGAKTQVSSVKLSGDNSVSEVDIDFFYYMYDSVSLFYGNGGGDCYIISVGDYKATPTFSKTDFDKGIEALKKCDEPTLILFPDAVNLNQSDYYTLQKSSLLQCEDLKDRFCVFDLRLDKNDRKETIDKTTFENYVSEFRDGIGMNSLKYGSLYAPWLNASLPRNFTYADIKDSIEKFSIKPYNLLHLASDAVVQNLISDYNNLVDDNNTIRRNVDTLKNPADSLKAKYENLVADFKQKSLNVAGIGVTRDAFRLVFDEPFKLIELIDNLNDANTINTLDLKTEIDTICTAVANSLTDLVVLDNIIGGDNSLIASGAISYPRHTDTTGSKISTSFGLPPFNWNNHDINNSLDNVSTNLTAFLAANLNLIDTPADDTERIENMILMERVISTIYNNFSDALDSILFWVNGAMILKEDSLKMSFPVYKNIINNVNNSFTLLPASGAIVGIYSYVDSTRGVWKAPANVSLNNVSSVNYPVDDNEQENLNVDSNSGKSINIIRAFTGKGNMVWGARTLAGNDNEWRYVSVRRFFNMVEESVKKSTSWAVFEPNDANTWNKVKGMIDNFLIIQWRNGALQGAKPDDAFFVKVGLGQTMTSLDILEGRMIVEIGMAVVRPAEFIILTFMHKLVTSS